MKIFLISIALISVCLLTACGPSNHDKNIAYKTSKPAKVLEFPPDLIKDQQDQQITNTLSDYQQVKIPELKKEVLPKFGEIKFVHEYGERWLESSKSPDELWGKLIEFWTKKIGVEIDTENKPAGILSTRWAENRAELNSGLISQYLRKVVDFAYSTDTRDKFHMRLERNNKTEIYISHQQMVQIKQDKSFIWTQGKNNPTLEAEVLARLMIFLGEKTQKAQAIKEAKIKTNPRAFLATTKKGLSIIKVLEVFSRAWRRIGNALSSSGITILDLNRNEGKYFINYADPEENEDSIFIREDKKIPYIILVKRLDEESTFITIRNLEGKLVTTESAGRIIEILQQQLK